jgi:hypothetical protein
MPNGTELDDVRNEVLRKIGRNVLNLQKMEGMLKLLNGHTHISGPVEDLESIRQKQKESVSRHTMGRLVQAFVQSVYSNKADGIIESDNDGRPSMSFYFTIEGDSNLAAEREKALLSIVEERNQLIHKDLLEFRPNSLESCIEMSKQLDAQHERILPEFDLLQSILKTFQEGRLRVAEYIQSDAFRQELHSSENSD